MNKTILAAGAAALSLAVASAPAAAQGRGHGAGAAGGHIGVGLGGATPRGSLDTGLTTRTESRINRRAGDRITAETRARTDANAGFDGTRAGAGASTDNRGTIEREARERRMADPNANATANANANAGLAAGEEAPEEGAQDEGEPEE